MSDLPQMASDEAERKIRIVVLGVTFTAIAMLLGGMVLLFGGDALLGGVLTAVGTIDLLALPFLSGALRRRAIASESGPAEDR